jgi:transcriptional regulator with PAS, ATPase and Fis domain
VAELPLAVQAKLLRVTQEKVVTPVGSTAAIPVDVRLISATHRSLRDEVAAGRFRADLLFRLRVIPLFLPPLRDRPADIALLLHRFLASENASGASRIVEQVSPEALRTLLGHSWPGNVRELQNVVQYACLLGDGAVLRESDLPDEVRGIINTSTAPPLPAPSSPSDANRVARALERANGNRNRAASSLGISRSTLWRKMREYNLAP